LGGGGGGAGRDFSTDGLEGLPLSTRSGESGLIRCSLGSSDKVLHSFFVGVSAAFGGVGGGGGAGGLSLMVNLEAPARTCLWSKSVGRSSDIETTPLVSLGLMAQVVPAAAQVSAVALLGLCGREPHLPGFFLTSLALGHP